MYSTINRVMERLNVRLDADLDTILPSNMLNEELDFSAIIRSVLFFWLFIILMSDLLVSIQTVISSQTWLKGPMAMTSLRWTICMAFWVSNRSRECLDSRRNDAMHSQDHGDCLVWS